MCDCIQFQSAATAAIQCNSTQFRSRKLGLDQCNWRRSSSRPMLTCYKDCCVSTILSNNRCIRNQLPVMDIFNQGIKPKSGVFGSNAFDSSSELRMKEGGDEHLEFDMQNGEEQLKELELGSIISECERKGFDDILNGENNQNNELGMLNFDEPLGARAEDLMALENHNNNNGKFDDNLEMEMEEEQLEDPLQSKPKAMRELKSKLESRTRNQLMKRSSILAKQVIGIESARSLGFVSQLWVDTATWAVLEVEVRPNLLSSDSVKFLLEDIIKVGDVVLVKDENCILDEFQTVGLESLVGCSVVTSKQRYLGKVRGYTFNINSGTVESLELDAFGYSVIPSSLVSTYALLTEDVLKIVSDVIVVRDAAASRIHRLTKGFLGAKYAETSSINFKYHDLESEFAQPSRDRKSKRKSSKRKSKFHPGTKDLGNDFELPMDYM